MNTYEDPDFKKNQQFLFQKLALFIAKKINLVLRLIHCGN